MNNLFDSDDSDEEPNTQPEQPSSTNESTGEVTPATTTATKATDSSSKNDNARLFGDDSDDSDEDDSIAAAANTEEPVEEEAAKPNATDEDSDADDAEFNADDDITGKRAPARHDSHEQSASPIAKISRVTVPDMPLAQFQNKNVNLHMAQLPKIVGIQPEAFSRDTFNSSLEDEEFNGGVHTMIRWKYKTDKDGTFIRDGNDKLIKESNAKIIKWSDGSYGLRVGDDLFDMDEFTFQLNKPTSGLKGKKGQGTPTPVSASDAAKRKGPSSKDFLYLTQKAQAVNDDGGIKPIGTVLECVASIQSKFIPRPASLKSAAHKNFVLKERSRVIKRKQIQEFVTFVDPEKQKAERIRNKDDLMKQEKRSGGGRSGGGRRKQGMNRSYMDEDDEHYDTVNIRSLKKRNMNDEDMDYGDDYGDDEEEDVWSKRKKKVFESGRKVGQQNDYSDEDEDLVVDDEDDEEMVSRKKKITTPQKGRASMFDSDSD